MHRLLRRQLKKINYTKGDVLEKDFKIFLDLVEKAYRDDDEDREFLEHTLEVSSKEMHDLYEELEKKSRSKLAQSEARFRALAKHDTLTGISNRFSLEEELSRLISTSRRTKTQFALLFLDLDHFKNINDSLGHDFGDKLLKEVVNRVAPKLRKEDIFARLGGDEFVIVLTNIDETKLSIILEKIISLFRKHWEVDGHVLNISTSIGVVLYPKDGNEASELLKNADIAMYRAKELGRDKFSFFTQELNERIAYEIQLEEDMFHALKRAEFELHFQPKIEALSGKIVGAEALIRWNHPKFGFLLPHQFIELAEDHGYIIKIGEWVLSEANRVIKSINALNLSNEMHIAVNVSLKQLQVSEFYNIVQRALVGIKPSQLIIEITESVMAEDIDFALHLLQKIQKLGVKISMDDFGTGYSSLAYLTKLPIDSIKIDKSFVDEIPKDESNKKILIDTIIAMANTLDKCVIAEGVEHPYQRKYLQKKGCNYFQGYLFSKPIDEQNYMELLMKESL
ncbi:MULTISPECIES: EAL domain-containing protein [Sulfurimonas]|uniref:putative bifunctional diguanylate cyclase/phosphodiesterase n=1 Tax=Sulfurimonas TaxID=202746 RepID=UPI001263EFAF|nr:EAL domain-containing protein [Sulfurimonas indica]